jgi:hypothetical protein
MTLLTTINAKAGFNPLLEFCWRELMFSLYPRILFFHEAAVFAFTLVRSYHDHNPHYQKHLQKVCWTYQNVQDVHPMSIFAFSICFYQTQKVLNHAVVVVALNPLEKWLITYTSYF